MGREVRWSRQAEEDLKRLDRRLRERIRRAVYRFAETGHGQVKQLRRPLVGWSLRVGNWRVRFTVDETADTIFIRTVDSRGRAYRRE